MIQIYTAKWIIRSTKPNKTNWEKILDQNEDQYCYATVYYQYHELYGFNQHNLTKKQYYDKCNTDVDVGEAIGITIQHHFLMEDTTQKWFK